jgi:Rieske Fe-S protein
MHAQFIESLRKPAESPINPDTRASRYIRRVMNDHTRRFFLAGSGCAAIGACTGCNANALDTLDEDLEVDLADHPELAMPGVTIKIDAGLLRPIAVTRVDDASFIATGTECDHQNCEVNRSGEGWVCGCHGSAFKLDGALTKGPAKSGLARYETRYDADTQLLTVLA